MRRRHQSPFLLIPAAGLLLTGCTVGGTDGGYRAADGPAVSRAPATPAPLPSPDDHDHLSTFALDVDTASWDFARRTLAEGRLPDPSTVRPEEFVNSFRQDYDRPGGDGFTVTVDGARTDDADWSLVRVGLATRAADREGDRPPAALTFVVDVSGSMAEPGRLDLARHSLGVMTDRLRDDDSVAIVAFSDEAETVLPMTRLGEGRDEVHDAIEDLTPADSTDLGAGIEAGYETAVEGVREGATNRVVLVSDALANDGDTDADTILERVAHERREHGVTLFGVGVGGDYGDALMERLADRGDGHTAYVSSEAEAREVFGERLPRHLDLTARDAKAQVAFDPETVEEYRLVGYENRRVADDGFRDDRVDGGETGPGHTVTALYAVRTAPGAEGHLATATVRWLDPDTRAPHEASGEVGADALDGSVWTADRGLRTAATAAYLADALRSGQRDPSLPGAPGLGELAGRARDLAARTEDEDVRELAEAIEAAARLLRPDQARPEPA
ncbi:von Willebrand factor type A domain-containing protein [Streptomyces sp. NPDC090994]|uniref:YfbK domain-containing protein n=1 Tax=Streptomyces sp. NPDC090994 TaxID=3365969 RepID=UPI0037FE472C